MPATGPVARVLLESPLPQLDRLLDYRIPAELSELAIPGVRVKVPLRSAGRLAAGYLVELSDGAEFSGKLSDLDSVVSAAPVLSPEIWSLARTVADRGAGNASDVLRLGIPGRQVRIEKAWLAERPGNTGAPASAIEEPDAAEDRDITDEAVPTEEFAPIPGYTPGQIERTIESAGRIALRAIPRLTLLAGGAYVGEWAVTLAQAAVHSVRGGESAILVVPDYRDQAQLEAALARTALTASVVRVDARQSNAERYRGFLRCLQGEPLIIVGNRSAVYAPAAHLGLIAVWDDGDPLHAEPLSPYAHARDSALVRAQQQNCALILAAHTRSVETQRLVEIGWLQDEQPRPSVTPRVIVTAGQASSDSPAGAARIPSGAWRAASEALESGPVLVQVANPGYAPVLACQTCRQAARCTVCEGPLGLTHSSATPTCGACGAIAAHWECANCHGSTLRLLTRGAGRTAEELGRAFPGVRVIVADGEKPVTTLGADRALVVATRGAEPIAAGGYRAILLLDGERMLARENLRVGDDCLRWWSNAAALAAQGAPVVLAGVGGPLAHALATWRQDAYASAELADRRELRFPPAVRIASVVGRADTVAAAIATIAADTVIDTLGPAPLPDGMVRSTVRFDYANGPVVAHALRAAVVRNATSRRKQATGDGRFRPAPTLKVRFDDPEIL